MNEQEIIIFNNPEFGDVRTAWKRDGTILFCASDVASSLGYTDYHIAIVTRCKRAIKREMPIIGRYSTIGGISWIADQKTVTMTFIPESDVYRLIIDSELPKAEEFEHWLFDEVVPAIHKYTHEEETLGLLVRIATASEDISAALGVDPFDEEKAYGDMHTITRELESVASWFTSPVGSSGISYGEELGGVLVMIRDELSSIHDAIIELRDQENE